MAITAAGAAVMLTTPPFTIFTFSSPSVISSSAIPDSWTRSISFFSLRRSMEVPLHAGCVPTDVASCLQFDEEAGILLQHRIQDRLQVPLAEASQPAKPHRSRE